MKPFIVQFSSSHFTSCNWGPFVFLETLFSDILSQFSSFIVKDQVLYLMNKTQSYIYVICLDNTVIQKILHRICCRERTFVLVENRPSVQ
jgi:hypothetical protein